MDYKISSKRKDTGKWWTYGNFKRGDKGYKLGMKKTPELIAYWNEVKEGEYLNFLAFEDTKEKPNYSPRLTVSTKPGVSTLPGANWTTRMTNCRNCETSKRLSRSISTN